MSLEKLILFRVSACRIDASPSDRDHDLFYIRDIDPDSARSKADEIAAKRGYEVTGLHTCNHTKPQRGMPVYPGVLERLARSFAGCALLQQ